MFWFISIVTCIILYVNLNSNSKKLTTIIFVIGVISSEVFVLTWTNGITDYCYLKEKLATIGALQDRMQDVKNSVYTYEKDGNFVAGSVENMNQSTNLSKYIAELAIKEGEYIGYLQRCIITKETFVLNIFGSGWAISDKIYDLPTTFIK